eukprot:6492186-Prymnesium_polylepis.1
MHTPNNNYLSTRGHCAMITGTVTAPVKCRRHEPLGYVANEGKRTRADAQKYASTARGGKLP